MQTMGGIFDSIGDWWNENFGSTKDYTAEWEARTGSSGASAGFGGDWSTSISPYLSYNNTDYSTQEDYWWKQYGAQSGVLPYTSTTPGSAASNTNFFGDVASGAGDFFNGVTSALSGLTGLFNQGAKAYFDVQQAINAMNPQDQVVIVPGTNQPFIRRDGQLVPLLNLYPQLQNQVTAAQKSQQTQTLLLVGVLGLGLFFILKDKKKK